MKIFEEVGICVNRVIYHSSQPWPIGSGSAAQLMLGFWAYCDEKALSNVIVNQQELESAQWFTREELKTALDASIDVMNRNKASLPNIFVPPPFAIAHHLIRSWVYSKPRM